MAYVGIKPNDRVLTSEDIKDGAVEMSDISWKNQPDNENISGTIDSFTVKLAEKFTLTGDIDISKDLVLTKLADDGEALVLTTDGSSRTIEGSGTISSNTFAQVPNASVTGMTGVLDNSVQDNITRLGTVTSGTIESAVTGSPALNLSNATFPVQRKIGRIERALDAASGTQQVTGIGFQPVYIEFTGAVDDQLSVFHGFADLTNNDQHWVGNRPHASNDWKVDQTVDLSLYLVGDGSANNCQQGKVTATDSDSFTITWTKFNSPSAGLTMKIIYRAYRY